MILLHIIQTVISVYLFHKLYSKPNCRCLKSRILDTSLVVVAFIPASALILGINFPLYATVAIMILTIIIIWFLNGYDYNTEEAFYNW